VFVFARIHRTKKPLRLDQTPVQQVQVGCRVRASRDAISAAEHSVWLRRQGLTALI